MCALCYIYQYMKQDEIFLLDPTLISEIQNAINSAHVSVLVNPSGKAREYYVLMPDGCALILGFEVIGTRCKYFIEINDNMVANMTIPAVSKNLTSDQSQILDLFSCCARKIAWQETYFIFARTIMTKKNKYRV